MDKSADPSPLRPARHGGHGGHSPGGAPLPGLHPAPEPFRTRMLEMGDGHRLHVEECGTPDGLPVVVLHGGPGGGCSPAMRRYFDPEAYRAVLFDQRNCGRSTPHAGQHATDLAANTTWHLVADIELLRTHLGIEAWQVFGGSWGSSLALAYAQRHPGRVTELVLRGIFTLRRSELDWFYEGPAGNVYPEAWQRFLAPVPAAQRADLVERGGDDADVTELREGRLRLVEHRVERGVGERPQHREHDPLGAAALGHVVMSDRDAHRCFSFDAG